MKMIIAFDYDKTYTVDPDFWKSFIALSQSFRHKVICLTMRRFPEEQIKDMPSGIEITYTDRRAKKIYADENGIVVDIWIDDKPAWLFEDALSV